MKYGPDPETWPEYRRAMKYELDAAGIPEDTVWEMVNSRFDYPQAVPIMVDWLQNLDDRVPPGEPRRAMRLGLMRNLITRHAKGNREAVEILFHQFDVEPPLDANELSVTVQALVPLLEREDFPRVKELLRFRPPGADAWDPGWWPPGELVRWLGKIKDDEAKQLALEQLGNERNRIEAMRALAQQRATGVRDAVARYLDDEHQVFRKEAAKTLAKLPDE
ncbi:HEAT repeat domain-containing protein [Mycolicibacter longobardus]|uniref:HEAT repeat domain-containing protein n=1 Tax=Mycolicibacter longobardus TaxID=1108812 RepID=UPI0021F26E7F|nr:HEAT repeat domain-containing protein [Mycolicibacter longobardus]MCV7385100.1 HEAT repeat domain-containing protein [Mycolicibacter longobardus]